MFIKSIELKHFRNHKNAYYEFSSGTNAIIGKNGAGKTNICEAIFLCCIAKSPRTDSDADLISFGENEGKVRLLLSRREGDSVIEITLFRKGRKKIIINGKEAERTGDLLGTLNAVFFSSDEIKIVRQSPAERRRFMDIDLSQSDKNYFYSISRYNRILSRRNALLKSVAIGLSRPDALTEWDILLSEEGARLTEKRREFISSLSPLAEKAHHGIAESESLSLVYLASIGEEGKEGFLSLLKKNYEKDIHFGSTSVGPHRDDIEIHIGEYAARTYGSSGQQRTAALSLKLAEVAYLHSLSGEMPLLILDDVFSELDPARQRGLLRSLSAQTIITSADRPSALPEKTNTIPL